MLRQQHVAAVGQEAAVDTDENQDGPVAAASDPTPVVPPQPLLGSYTLANTGLGSSFGENPMGRRAVVAFDRTARRLYEACAELCERTRDGVDEAWVGRRVTFNAACALPSEPRPDWPGVSEPELELKCFNV